MSQWQRGAEIQPPPPSVLGWMISQYGAAVPVCSPQTQEVAGFASQDQPLPDIHCIHMEHGWIICF